MRAALAGTTKRGAEQLIVSVVGSPAPPIIKVSPGWAPRLPRKTVRIDVTFAPAPR